MADETSQSAGVTVSEPVAGSMPDDVSATAPNPDEPPASEAGPADRNTGDGNGVTEAGPASPDETPITDWGKVDLELPGDAAVDENALASFGEKAVELGLTPNQAKALAKWQLDAIAGARSALMDSGIAQLRKDWGRKAEANQRAVLTLIGNIDRRLGNDSFSKALELSGATMHASVCKGLLEIAGMLSEDSFGQAGGLAARQEPETALQGIENAFREMRARN